MSGCITSHSIGQPRPSQAVRVSAFDWPHRSAVGWWVCCTFWMSLALACTRAINYCNKNIADILAMDVADALQFFANHPKITRALDTLNHVGLDYLKIGQSATTLSGGEAQRIKLASELCRVATGRTLYILDAATT